MMSITKERHMPSELYQKILDIRAPRRDRRIPAHINTATFLPGFRREQLATLFQVLGYTSGAEIGVAGGHYSETMSKANPGVHIHCVDPWMKYRGNRQSKNNARQEQAYQNARTRLAPYNITYCRMLSAPAAETIPEGSLDFVYIDGNHQYEFVKQDLELWSRRVRSGGIIAGHDYYSFLNNGVIRAVDEHVATHDITEWYLTDDRWARSARTGEWNCTCSYFWIKP